MTPATPHCEVLVIGAGPAGLVAAIYLARFRRRIILADTGRSRALYIPVSRNCPGFAHGINGEELLRELRRQAAVHGVEPRPGAITSLTRNERGFRAATARGSIAADFVILATGVTDALPPLRGVEEAVCRGVVRLCAVCDAYETQGLRVAVYGPGDAAVSHARYLRSFCGDVAVLATDGAVDDAQYAQCATLGIRILVGGEVTIDDDTVRVRQPDGAELSFDALYSALEARANSDLAVGLGVRCDPGGDVIVDPHMRTNIDGCYAIGDIVKALNQIAVASGQAAIAATDIHNRLPFRPLNG
jgi:thioredoxin reductase (NADPH)